MRILIFPVFVALVITFNCNGQIRICKDKLPRKIESYSGLSGVPDFNYRWPNGSLIKVKFLGGSQYVRSKVIAYARIWENHANVKFSIINSGRADILISFVKGDGSWSAVGKDSQYYARKNEPTMNFGWFDETTTDEEFRRTTLHEFGHALGLHHEHQHPMGAIRWNKPVVYNHYLGQGWSIDDINSNIFGKYGETLSNFKYDPYSIMHYPIPEDFTLDGYSVGWNTELSKEDKRVIGEMYPTLDNTTYISDKTGKIVSATLNDFTVDHNILREDYDGNESKGMEISIDFVISNAKATSCRASAYFSTREGVKLKDKNDRYKTTSGNVSSGTDFTPKYDSSRFRSLKIFLPYDELELGDGEFRLKFNVIIWDEDRNNLIRSGDYNFVYTKGIIVKELETIVTKLNNNLSVKPKFSVKNAKDINCSACVFFYNDSDEPLVSELGGAVSFCEKFKPGYANTSYNKISDNLEILIPYNSIPIPLGEHRVKYFVALFNNSEQFGTGKWQEISLIRN